jgi:hypothetical protein
MILPRCAIKPRRTVRRAARLSSALLLLIAFLFVVGLASATPLTRPFWTEQAMFQFGEDVFFVGQSSCAPTAEEGRQRAFTQGMQELLNYAQSSNTTGLSVDTQMVFEEVDSSGCPVGTVTVWRLLRVNADRLAQVTRHHQRRPSLEGATRAPRPSIPTPSVGMSRDEVFDRFGLPASMTMRHGGEFLWEYRRFGFMVEFNRQMFVKRWTVLGAPAREDHDPQSPVWGTTRPSVATHDASIVDLTARLRALEEVGRASMPTSSTVYNQEVFAKRPIPVYVERSLTAAEASSAASNRFPAHEALSEKVSALWICRADDGGPGRGALLQTRHGVMINPACVNPWNR